MNWIYILAFGLSLGLALALTPLVIKLARAKGFIVQPREDRWHRRPTALLGGVAIFLAVAIPYLILVPLGRDTLAVLLGGAAMFVLGLYDDIYELAPQRKFLLQIVIAAGVVLSGVRLIIIDFAPLAVFLTILWIVGITNAINILDNMDGLSSGITFVASAFSFVWAYQSGLPLAAVLALLLAGAALGFLAYNFNPARIFMGDSGSLFLGFSLSLLTILGTWREATNLMASLMFPVALLAVPIFDTTLVSFERTRSGRSIAQGGRDHSSHRLVFLGVSERRAVLILMAIAAGFGLLAIYLKNLTLFSSLVVLALVAVGLTMFGVFLGAVKVYPAGEGKGRRWSINSPLLTSILTFKKQIFQILIDTTLVAAAYFIAYLLRYGQSLHDYEIYLIEITLPFMLLIKLSAFAVFGLYRGDWRYVSLHDLGKVFKAVSLGWVVAVVSIVLYMGAQRPPLGLLGTDYVLTLMVIGGVRVSFRAFKEYFAGQRLSGDDQAVPVVIFGAGDGGELLLRELRNNPKLNKRPVGFIDDDPSKHGLQIHGLKVLGDRHRLPELAAKYGLREVHVAILSAKRSDFADLEADCERLNLVCRWIVPILTGLEDDRPPDNPEAEGGPAA